MIIDYIRNISIMSKSTAYEYLFRLNNFKTFIKNEYHGLGIDDLITRTNIMWAIPLKSHNGLS